MAEGTVQTIHTTAPPDVVFGIAMDLDQYPEWASGVRAVDVTETDDEGRPRQARFTIDGMIRKISVDLVYEYEEPSEMTWTAIPGDDIEIMDGKYEFFELEDGTTEIVYALRVETRFSIPGFLRRQAEKQIVGTALRGLKARAEGMAEEA